MNLANLPNLAKSCTFYTKYLNLNSKCSLYRFKTFFIKKKIKFKQNLNFDTFKELLILTNLGKFGRKITQICSA